MPRIALHPVGETTLVETGGTLLSGLLARDLKVLMSCGGKGLCSTCHVRVKRGADQLSEVTAREKRTLALVADAGPASRLACQCRVYGEGVEVEVPEGMYIESADDLVALLGTRAAVNILHPVTGVVLIPKGKVVTRTLLEQSRGVAKDLQRAKSGEAAAGDSTSHRAFLASGAGAPPNLSATTRHTSSRTVFEPGANRPAVGQPHHSTRTPVPPGTTTPIATEPVLNLSTAPVSAVQPVDRPSGIPSSPPMTLDPVVVRHSLRSVTPLQGGTMVGKYLLIECIGRGGAGMVYRALHTKLKTPVAVKFLRPDVVSTDPEALTRFTREAQLLAQLVHPNVVRVLDYEDEPSRPYVVMEYVDGLSAADLIKQGGRVAADRAVGIALDVLEGLDAARRIGVVHRDVKPGNVLLARDGTSKLVDLGLAVVCRPGETVGGTPAAAEGTVGYMAPEQALGSAVDHRADQYSLGCTLYHLVTGRLPFTGRSPHEVMLQHMRVPPVPPHEVAPGVPTELSRTILTMMEKSAADRYPDYAALRADLAAVVHR